MKKETKKQIIFDIDTKIAEKILGKNYRKIYSDIKKYLEAKGFTHIEGSGYMSKNIMSSIQVTQIIIGLIEEYPYLSKCIRDIRQTNVVDEQSLNDLFDYDGTVGRFGIKEQEIRPIKEKIAEAKQKVAAYDKKVQNQSVIKEIEI